MYVDPLWTVQQTTAAVTEALRNHWGEERLRDLAPRIGLVAGWLHELSRHPVPALGPEPDFIAQCLKPVVGIQNAAHKFVR